ncbi:MAG: hypothetical protein D6740_09955, partial [Alphaproteobacteria bacterium]
MKTATSTVPAGRDAALTLARLAEQIRRVMAEELAIHRTGRPREAEALIAEKARLAAEYQALAKALLQDEAWLTAREHAQQRARLKQELSALQSEIEAHVGAIRRYRLLTEGVVRAVAEEIERQRSPFKGYGPAAAG